MKNKMIRTLLALLVMAGGTFGQVGFSLETESGYTSNVFANYSSLPDYYTSIHAYLNSDWIADNQGLRWFYKGSLTAFKKFQDRTYQNHKSGLVYYYYFGSGEDKLDAGINFSTRMHSEEYRWYETRQYDAFLNAKLVITDQLFAYWGANVRWRDYAVLKAFSHIQSVLFWRLSRFFDTGTSLIFEADLLNKKYDPSAESSTVESLPEIVTIGDGHSQQFVGLLKLGQSLGPRTGSSFQFVLRRNLLSSVRYLGTTSGYYYSDEEMFDDVYGYSSEEFGATLKHIFPWKMKISLGANVIRKHYDDRLALDPTGNPFPDERLRADTRWIGWMSLEKSLRLSKNVKPMTLALNYSFVRNVSNDPYYDYKTGYISIGFEQRF